MSVVAREDWTRIFANVTGEDEEKARESFDALCVKSRDPGLRMLRRYRIDESDAQDIVQSTFAELWKQRRNLSASTEAAWYALVRRSLTWQFSKRLEKRDRELLLAQEAIPEDEHPYLDEMIVASEDREKLYEAADELWLGPLEAELVLGVAAARMILFQGLGPSDVAAMFNVSEKVVNQWLRETALLARAVYSGLYWSVDRLAGYVLRPDQPLTPEELDLLTNSSERIALDGWSETEIRIVCWRLRNGLSKRGIIRASGGKLDLDEVQAALFKLHVALPLLQIARSVRQSLTEGGHPNALTMPGIWKRLAFQYAVKELPNSQIVDLAGPPASVGPFVIDASKLNRWVTSGLLFSELTSYVQERRK